MNDVKIFENPEFGRVRTTVIDGEPWFVAADVCHALDIGNPSDALNRLDDDERTLVSIEGASNGKPVNGVNEPGLYSLVLGSRKPEAKAFKRWITHEVIPAIRKTGGYQVNELTGRELMAKALLEAQAVLAEKDTTIAKQTQLIGELKPKADYTDRILQSKSLVTITQIAKDYGMSGAAMNEKLHELGVIYKLGGQWLLYSRYQAKGYTHSETVNITHKDGSGNVRMNTKWTQKGRLFLYGFLKKHGILPVIEQNHDEKPLLTIVG